MGKIPPTYRIAIFCALLFITVALPFSGRKMGYTVDASPTFQLTKAIVETGDLFPPLAVKQGYIYSIVYIPFYHLGTVAHPLFPGQDIDWVRRKMMCLMNTLLTAVIIGVLVLCLATLQFSLTTQTTIPLLYGFSTMAFAYSHYDYNKVLASLLLILTQYFVFAFIHQKKNGQILLSGSIFAALVMLRLEMITIAPILLFTYLRITSNKRLRWKRCLYFCAPVFLALVLVYAYNQMYWSGDFAGGYKANFSWHPFTGMMGFLASPGKNIWFYNPILVLLPIAIPLFYRKARISFLVLSSCVLTLFLFYSFWGNWWGGWGFGPRHLVPLIPLAVIPLASIVESGNKIKVFALLLLGAIGFGVQIIGSALDFNDVILTLMREGIQEQELLWHPAWNPLLYHIHFILHSPLERLDFAFAFLASNISPSIFILILLAWIGWILFIVYMLYQTIRTSQENIEETI